MRIIAIVVMGMFCGPGLAQEPMPQEDPQDADLPLVEAEEVRRYSVEVIIFEYSDGATVAGEVFLPDEVPAEEELSPEPVIDELVLPDYRGRLRALRDYENIPLEEISLHGPVEMFLLQPEEFTLTEAWQRLQRLDAYNPVMHAGWVQTTVEPDIAPAMSLRRLGDPPLRLDGTLTLYLSRYLHLVVDLALKSDLEMPPEEPEQEDVPYYGDYEYADGFGDTGTAAVPQLFYRINEDRIFRNGDIRYFDHPKFGVLAKIARYEVEEEPLPADTDEEFLLPAAPLETP